MKINLLPALAAVVRRYRVARLYYVMQGEEAFERFQAIMVTQAYEKSYDYLDIQGRQWIDTNDLKHTKQLLQSVEIADRGSKEERHIVLDLSHIDHFIKLLMQVIGFHEKFPNLFLRHENLFLTIRRRRFGTMV